MNSEQRQLASLAAIHDAHAATEERCGHALGRSAKAAAEHIAKAGAHRRAAEIIRYQLECEGAQPEPPAADEARDELTLAAINGLCLEPENGGTERYGAADVERLGSGAIRVRLNDGRTAAISIRI